MPTAIETGIIHHLFRQRTRKYSFMPAFSQMLSQLTSGAYARNEITNATRLSVWQQVLRLEPRLSARFSLRMTPVIDLSQAAGKL